MSTTLTSCESLLRYSHSLVKLPVSSTVGGLIHVILLNNYLSAWRRVIWLRSPSTPTVPCRKNIFFITEDVSIVMQLHTEYAQLSTLYLSQVYVLNIHPLAPTCWLFMCPFLLDNCLSCFAYCAHSEPAFSNSPILSGMAPMDVHRKNIRDHVWFS